MDKAKLPGQRLRLVPGPRGEVGLILHEPREEDSIIEVDREPLLLLHPTLTPPFGERSWTIPRLPKELT